MIEVVQVNHIYIAVYVAPVSVVTSVPAVVTARVLAVVTAFVPPVVNILAALAIGCSFISVNKNKY